MPGFASLRLWAALVLAAPGSAGLAGCQSAVLKPDMIDMAGTVGPIYMGQVLSNLENFANDPETIPSQIDISTGQITLSSNLNPSLTIPLGNQVARGATNSITTVTDPYRSLTLGASITRGGNWSVTAVSDPSRMQNLAALYQYALDANADEFVRRYHIPVKITPISTTDVTKVAVGVDPTYLLQPSCVFCMTSEQIQTLLTTIPNIYSITESMAKRKENLNPDLRYPQGKWLYYIPRSSPLSAGKDPVGKHLWITQAASDERLLPRLVPFLLLSAAPGSDASSASGGGGGKH